MQFRLTLAFLLAAFCVGNAMSLSCPSGRWECLSVSEDWNFVTCNEGTCECLSELGFVGKAQENDTCRCDKTIHWEGGLAYCFDFKEAAKLKNDISRLDYDGNMKTRLDWFSGGSYTISGTYQYQSGSNAPTNPAKLAIDVENQKLFFDHVTNVHWLWPKADQVINGISFASIFVVSGKCYLSNFTSINQSNFHKDDVWIGSVINYQNQPVKQFVGKSFDHHVAEYALITNHSQRLASFTEQTYDGIITSWTWDNLYNVFGVANRRLPQSAVFNITSLVRGTPEPSLWDYPLATCRSNNTFWYSDLPLPPASQRPLF